ncbi:MAG: RHS repeat-associated core domain-containing protein, partial [Betaproteobacteria bacterium]
YRYSAYGETASSGEDEGNAIQYTARENDGTGLYFYRARYYDPVMKRFISSDPIGLAGGINTYSYVENNPLSFTDPEGLVKLHGNWCGPNWTGGFNKSYDKLSDAERRAALPPVTKLDSCCQTHDIVYAVCRKANPCDAVARQKCFEQADRNLSSCASRSGSGYGANLLLFGNPQKRIQDYMRDSSPAAEDNAKECSCTK